jgi:hypothetical protein
MSNHRIPAYLLSQRSSSLLLKDKLVSTAGSQYIGMRNIVVHNIVDKKPVMDCAVKNIPQVVCQIARVTNILLTKNLSEPCLFIFIQEMLLE